MSSSVHTNSRPLLVSALAFCMMAAFGCTTSGEGPGVTQPPPDNFLCENNDDCPDGNICSGGSCKIGSCDPSLALLCQDDPNLPYCCKSFQLCNQLNECVANPDAPVGGQCVVSNDCPGVGEFCSGGNCFSPAGREPCTASFQCPASERCDLTVFLCVPDDGGCSFCSEFPELCCEDGTQVCDVETGFCLDIAEAECTEATVLVDCRANQKCDNLGRCVQCINNDDCGPGTECNVGTGSCFSILNQCETDDDCENGRRCVLSANECVNPQCERDNDCEDRREFCDLTTFSCFLPPAVCESETDEPNESIGEATPILGLAAAGTLCRGNTDYLSFPVTELKRYSVNVEFTDFTVEGVSASLLDADGVIIDTKTYGSFTDDVTLNAVTTGGVTGNYFVRVVGSGAEEDDWTYIVTITETEAPEAISCEEEIANGIEPNDTFADAHDLVAGTSTFSRCGDEDDIYRIEIPALNGVEVDVIFENDDGDMVADLYYEEVASFTNYDDHSDSSSDNESVQGIELDPSTDCLTGDSCTVYWLRVSLYQFDSNPLPIQSYSVTVTAIPRPAQCLPDDTEPDGSLLYAAALPVNEPPLVAKRCTPSDVDFFAITIPASAGGSIAINFDHAEGDLRLDLRDDAGELVDGSNRSTAADGAEVIDLPFSAEETNYFAVVRINAGSGTVGQDYSIAASSFDASSCVLSEPVGNNDFVNGQCIGTFDTISLCAGPTHAAPFTGTDLASCQTAIADGINVPGCATTCGAGDEDFFRVGKLNNGQRLSARLSHANVDGNLGITILRANADLSNSAVIATNVNATGDDDVEISIIADTVVPEFAREYAVVVRPQGTAGYQAQPYSIEIEIGPECLKDVNDAVVANNTWPAATRLRTVGDPTAPLDETLAALTLCASDIDVFEVFSFENETLTATLDGPSGLELFIGNRPADGTPVLERLVDGIDINAGADAGPPPVGSPTTVTATIDNDSNRQLFFSIGGTDPAAIGTYTLRIEVAPTP